MGLSTNGVAPFPGAKLVLVGKPSTRESSWRMTPWLTGWGLVMVVSLVSHHSSRRGFCGSVWFTESCDFPRTAEPGGNLSDEVVTGPNSWQPTGARSKSCGCLSSATSGWGKTLWGTVKPASGTTPAVGPDDPTHGARHQPVELEPVTVNSKTFSYCNSLLGHDTSPIFILIHELSSCEHRQTTSIPRISQNCC